MPDEMLFSFPKPPVMDYAAHNAEGKAVWEAFNAASPIRVPIRLNTNPRVLMLDPKYNTRGLSYEQYFTDPELMWPVILEWQYWTRHFLFTDSQMGLPEKWLMFVDFENTYDQMFFGCEIEFFEGQVPASKPLLAGRNKRLLFDRGLPDPLGGEWMQRLVRFIEVFKQKAEREEFMGRPVSDDVWCGCAGTDGVFTAAFDLRGGTELCIDMYEDPDYVHQLLDFLTDALIARMEAFRKMLAKPLKDKQFFIADDAIQLISVEAYKEFVLPCHRRLAEHFAENPTGGNAAHLCGDAQRFFPLMHDELGVDSFDTGFPVDFAWVRRTLGPDVTVSGGPHVRYFMQDDPSELLAETKRILASGIMEGGKFVLQEGNNLPPRANLEACRLFYETGKEFGKYE